jgi:LPXTG-motif cell wall-anchored protein
MATRSLFSMVQPKYAMSSQEARALDAFETGRVRAEATAPIFAAAPVDYERSAMPDIQSGFSTTTKVALGAGVVALAVGAFVFLRKKKR